MATAFRLCDECLSFHVPRNTLTSFLHQILRMYQPNLNSHQILPIVDLGKTFCHAGENRLSP
jgi:hypothetical protein